MKKSINIFLLNIHSDRNAGDYALSRVSVSQLINVFPYGNIVLSMNDPESYEGEYPVVNSPFVWIKQGNNWLWGRLIKFIVGTFLPVIVWRYFQKTFLYLTPKSLRDWVLVYIKSDIIVSTAGGYQYSSGKGITFLLLNYILILSILGKKPLYFLPQSFGPYNYSWEKTITRIVCNRSRIVMVREPVSLQNLIECNIHKDKIVLLPDIAFGFIGATQEEANHWFINHGIDLQRDRPLLGMTVIDWRAFYPRFHRQLEYEDAIISLIEFFSISLNGKVIILPQTWGPTQAEDDRVIANKIGNKLTHLSNNLLVINQSIHPQLLQAIFGTMDVVVGTRMHSNIFAMTHGVPALPIGYLHKSVGIAQMLGVEQWVIDINEIDSDILIQRFKEFWQQKEAIKSTLQVKIKLLIEESKRAGSLIYEDYHKIAGNN